MYQSFVYLETRILLSPVVSVFKKNQGDARISVDSSVMQKVFILTRALGCSVPDTAMIEHLTGNLPEPPEGKKISGFSVKVAEGGSLDIMFHSRPKTIHIEEVRIEEDSGHLTHADGQSRMDFTWAGSPSIRLKTTPSFELGEEAELFLDELRRLTQYLDLVNREAAEGGIRSNAFVALSKYPELPCYYVKLRNLNSFNFVRKAVNYELSRQENILSSGGAIAGESRIWDEKQSRTEIFHSRNSELRRFEPLVPSAEIDVKQFISAACEEKTELPQQRRSRFRNDYGVSRLRAEFLCDEKGRADYFEKAVAEGAAPLDAAHWMASELVKLLKVQNTTLAETRLTPEKFAEIIKKLTSHQIHSGIAKQLMQSVAETGESPDVLLKKKGIVQLADENILLPYIKKVISENPELCVRLKSGEMPPLEFLTGLVMKKTGGMAVPQQVKALIKRELKISIIYVLNMGGVMTAVRHQDGSISSGDPRCLKEMLAETDPDIPVQIISVGQFLSEELEPADWAALIHEIAVRIAAGTANGIVITHGTDTLAYTSALLFWLFSDAEVPIVLTASSALSSESEEPKQNLSAAVRLACEKKGGVYVSFGGSVYSPLNLRFIKPARDGFRNLNMAKTVFTESGPVSVQFATIQDPDTEVMAEILQEAAGKMVTLRMYPGFRSDVYKRLLQEGEGIHTVFLELYDTGTVNMRTSDYSLKPLFHHGHNSDIRFYCTSQQESSLNLSQYITGMRVWREGAVPMGQLSTESAVALYFACSLVADSDVELDQLMETYAEIYCTV
jgi:aspartyl-tRNA(Asn)/glutamyl-tRNA(Gln) amidotransferase subunit B